MLQLLKRSINAFLIVFGQCNKYLLGLPRRTGDTSENRV